MLGPRQKELYPREARLAEGEDTELRLLPKTADYGLPILQNMQC